MQFKPFSQAVAAQFALMSAHELYTVDIAGDDLYALYLASFPEGTNPMFRERTEHDCSCCKNFIRNIGNVVAIIDGHVVTVWDTVANQPEVDNAYRIVALQLAALVYKAKITGIYRTQERKYGAESNAELRDGVTRTWNHFHGTIDKKHFSQTPDKIKGKFNANLQVFRRGVTELTLDAFQTVLDLIAAKSLYRGEEFLPTIQKFLVHVLVYRSLNSPQEQEIYLMTHAGDPATRFRNSAIGTLVTVLSDGVDLETAVKAFEKMVAPENYKRTTSLITPGMIKQAMETINELGLEPALQRRHANIHDVTMNNVLWADNRVQPMMKGGLEGLLMGAVKAAPLDVDKVKAIDVSIEDFLKNVVPQAEAMDVIVKNSQVGNFMSVTAPVHSDVARLFKWDNNFAWSYAGNIADSDLRKQVQSLGGRIDGVLRFSHMWNYDKRNASLMDLHVFMPGSTEHREGCHDSYPHGQRVGWNNRQDYQSGGEQDVDYTGAAPVGYVPVENITFPSMDKLKEGTYTFKIHNWQLRAPTEGGFKCEIEFGGQVFQYERKEPLKHKEWVTVAVATLKNGEFTIEHKMPCSTASQDKWGIKTMVPVAVKTLMFSPNYWDDNATGNKHVFFILEGCKNDEPTRGIYNEFLRSDLEKHRKVFEILGAQTKCPVVDDQLSGVGFSSTKGDAVLVVVTSKLGRKTYNVKF